jgi:hypothetical protein
MVLPICTHWRRGNSNRSSATRNRDVRTVPKIIHGSMREGVYRLAPAAQPDSAAPPKLSAPEWIREFGSGKPLLTAPQANGGAWSSSRESKPSWPAGSTSARRRLVASEFPGTDESRDNGSLGHFGNWREERIASLNVGIGRGGCGYCGGGGPSCCEP